MSSAWIHGRYWRPPATGPPMPRRKKGSIFASAPPSWSSTTPVRSMATRSPCSAARGGLALPRDAHPGQEVVAGRGVLGDRLVAARAVVADGRGADQDARARLGGADARDEVARADLARVADRAPRRSSVQRWATFSPARCTTASRPLERRGRRGLLAAAARRAPRRRRGSARARSGSRESTVTASPRACSARDDRGPDEAGGAGEGDVHGWGTPSPSPDGNRG